MHKVVLTIPEVAFIAATRGALGVGVGLLIAEKIRKPRRQTLGLSLLTLGLVATIPAAKKVFGRR
jgi:hypothetical protein